MTDERAILTELVRLKDLKQRLEARDFAGPLISTMSQVEYEEGRADYIMHKEAAWAAARAILSTPQPVAQGEPSNDEFRRIVQSIRTSASDDESPAAYVRAGWRAARSKREDEAVVQSIANRYSSDCSKRDPE